MADATLLPVALTLLAFVLGLGVGYLWWGRSFVRARLTRDEALSIMRREIERDLPGGGWRPGGARGPGAVR